MKNYGAIESPGPMSERKLRADVVDIWDNEYCKGKITFEECRRKIQKLRQEYDQLHGEDSSAKALGFFIPMHKRPQKPPDWSGDENREIRETVLALAFSSYLKKASTDPQAAAKYHKVLECKNIADMLIEFSTQFGTGEPIAWQAPEPIAWQAPAIKKLAKKENNQ